jgi:hypothetical protein
VSRTPDSLRERAIAEYERQRREEEAAAAKRQAEHERRQAELAQQRAERITALADRGVELLVGVMRERLQTEIDPDAVTFGPYDHVRESLEARVLVDGIMSYIIVNERDLLTGRTLYALIPCRGCGANPDRLGIYSLEMLGRTLAARPLCDDCEYDVTSDTRTPTPTRPPR